MCRLQFTSPAHSEVEDAPLGDQDALEALLALSADNGVDNGMEYDLSEPAGAEPTLQQSSRYHCPFPGCKRSFAELWRLKVHYRAPPNIRGSGKERGHGMRLTHCPKCGAALKVGGHHVKCAAVTKEPASNASNAGRRNRKAGSGAAHSSAVQAPDVTTAVAAAAEAAQVLAQPTNSAEPTGAAGSSKRMQYQQYALSGLMQQDMGGSGLLWQRALQLQTQQQQQAEDTIDEAGMSYLTKPGFAAAVAAAGLAKLQRVPSSDDSSSSRAVDAASNDNCMYSGPSSSSGSGAGPEDADTQQQQQQLLSLYAAPNAPAADPCSAAVKLEGGAQQLQQHDQQQQHQEAGQLLWQHMLLQHLQQHVQQTPGFSLTELIQVAAALFGNRVDTLVSAFGLSGPSARALQEQEELARLVGVLREAGSTHALAGLANAGPVAAAGAGYGPAQQ